MPKDSPSEELERHKKQIQFHEEQNRMLMQFLEEAKASREFLQKQLELHQEREKLSLLREQRDYQRIVELEKKIELLMPPEVQAIHPMPSNEMSSTIDEIEPISKDANKDTPEAFWENFSQEEDEFLIETQNAIGTLFPDSETNTMDSGENAEAPLSTTEPPVETPPPPISNSAEEPSTATQEVATPSEEEPSPPIQEAETTPPAPNSAEETSTAIREVASPSEETSTPPQKIATAPPAPPSEEKTSTTSEKIATTRPIEPANTTTQESNVDPNFLINKYFNEGLTAAEQNNFSEAITAFTQVTTLLPEAAPSFLNLAILNFRLGNHSEALQFCEHAINRGSEAAHRLHSRIQTDLAK